MKSPYKLMLLLGLLALPLRADDESDTDGDGLTDTEEAACGTDPSQIDTDGDTLTDGQEADLGTDPRVVDSDGDGFEDALEIGWTDPADVDTDGDGLTDGSEVLDYRSDPLSDDSDGDGLADSGEISLGTGLLVADSDADGLLDGTETSIGLDATSGDSNGDGVGDSQFITHSSHPTIQLQSGGAPHQIQFTALPYVSYDVMFSTDLQNWQALARVSSTTAPTSQSIAEPVAGSPKGFFSLKPH